MFNATVIMGFSRHQKAKAMREQNAKKKANTIQNENEKKGMGMNGMNY